MTDATSTSGVRRDHALNPFPGPRPYRADERSRFFGRDEMIVQLSRHVLAHRCTTLFGPSGAGKSSLMQAAVLPGLTESRDFRCVSVDTWPPSQDPRERLVVALAETLEGAVSTASPSEPEAVIDRAELRSERPIVILLDQLEQLLFSSRDPAALEQLLAPIERLVQRPRANLHVVLSLREDYLGRFRDRGKRHPRLLEHGFRVHPLTVGELTQAVSRAAAEGGRPPLHWLEADVAFVVGEMRAPGEEGGPRAEAQSAFVQIVFQSIWQEHVAAGGQGSIGRRDPDAILASHLTQTLAALGPHQGAARRLLEEHLVDPEGHRTLLTQEEAIGRLQGVDAELVLSHLEAAAVLRAEQHQGTRVYELGHDALAEMVFADRMRREQFEKEHAQRQELARIQAEAKKDRNRALIYGVLAAVAVALLAATVVYALRAKQAKTDAESARNDAERETTNAHVQEVLATIARKKSEIERKKTERQKREAERQKRKAELQKRRAQLQKKDADTERDKAKRAGAAAVAAKDAAKAAAFQALIEARRARDATLLAEARKLLQSDPTTALALLREVEEPDYARDWSAAVVEALQVPVSRKILRHDGPVVALSYSPMGDRLATASHDGSARVWDTVSGEELKRFDGHGDRVVDVTYCPARSCWHAVASLAMNGTGRIWRDDESSVVTKLVTSQCPRLSAIEFSRDGALLLAGCQNGKLAAWAIDDIEEDPQILECGKSRVRTLTFHPDGRALLSGTNDGKVCSWRLDGSRLTPLAILDTSGPVNDATFVGSSGWAATVGNDALKVWNATDERASSPLGDVTYSVESKATVLLTASRDQHAAIWKLTDVEAGTTSDVPTVAPLLDLLHTAKVHVARFSPDFDEAKGGIIATASADGLALLWDIDLEDQVNDYPRTLSGHDRAVVDVLFAPDRSRELATASLDGTVRLWAVESGKLGVTQELSHPSGVRRVAFASDDDKLVTACNDGSTTLWSRGGAEWKRSATLTRGTDGAGLAALLEPGSTRAHTVSEDGVLAIWDVEGAGARLSKSLELPGLDGIPTFASLHWGAGGLMVLASTSGTVQLYALDPRSDELVRRRTSAGSHAGVVRHAMLDRTGTRMVTTGDDRVARIWSLANERGRARPVELVGHDGAVYYAAFDDEGARVVTSSWDGKARIWDAETGTLLQTLYEGSDGPVNSAEFNHPQTKQSGLRVVTTHDDGTVRIWNATDGRLEMKLGGHRGPVLHGVFSPDGLLVATGSSDGTVLIRDVGEGKSSTLKSWMDDATKVELTPKQRQAFSLSKRGSHK